MKWLCKIGIHKWRNKYFHFPDRPLEGYQGRKCMRCGIADKKARRRY